MEYSERIIDQDADLFYDNVRAFVVVFLTLSALLPLTYFLIALRKIPIKKYASKDDSTVNSIVMVICTTTLTTCVIMVFMLPLSILANEVLILFPDCYYVQWINAGLLHTFFVLVQAAFKALCVCIPLGFFLLTSHSVYTGSKAVSARFISSVVYLGVTYLASAGIATTLFSIFRLSYTFSMGQNLTDSITAHLPRACLASTFLPHSWPFQLIGDILCCIDGVFTIVQQLISYIGLGLLLICIPSGIFQLLKVTSNQALVHLSNEEPIVRKVDEAYRIKLKGCLQYINSLNGPLGQPLFEAEFQIHLLPSYAKQCEFSNGSIELCKVAPRSARSLLSSVAFIVLQFLFVIAALYASANVLVLLYNLCLSWIYGPAEQPSSSGGTILLGHESVSKFGFLGAGIQALVVSIIFCTSLIGFYTLLPVRKHLYPHTGRSGMALLLFNAACLLSMSSAVPLQASLLGLATPSFPPVYYASLLYDVGFCRAPDTSAYLLSPPASAPPPPPAPTSNPLAPFQLPSMSLGLLSVALEEEPSIHSQQSKAVAATATSKQQQQQQTRGFRPSAAHLLPAPPPPMLTRGEVVVLLYNVAFIGICWWFFHGHAGDLVRVKDHLTSALAVKMQRALRRVSPRR